MNENTQLWLLPIEDVRHYSEDYFALYFPRRLEQSRRFRFPEDALRSLGAGVLLHELLGLDEGRMEIAPGGKPRALAGKPEFNLSHSGDYAVLAVSASIVGVDIERKELRHIAVAKSVFQDEELCWMNEKPDERFTALWTMKEAVSKALGLGLGLRFRDFNVLPLFSGEPIEVQGKRIYGCSLPLDGYSLSLCTVGEMGEVEIHQL